MDGQVYLVTIDSDIDTMQQCLCNHAALPMLHYISCFPKESKRVDPRTLHLPPWLKVRKTLIFSFRFVRTTLPTSSIGFSGLLYIKNLNGNGGEWYPRRFDWGCCRLPHFGDDCICFVFIHVRTQVNSITYACSFLFLFFAFSANFLDLVILIL